MDELDRLIEEVGRAVHRELSVAWKSERVAALEEAIRHVKGLRRAADKARAAQELPVEDRRA